MPGQPQRAGGRAARRGGRARLRPIARHRGEREALMRIAAATADAYRLEDVMEQAAEAALAVTGAASLSISRWEPEEGVLRTLINVGELGDGEERFPLDELYPVADYPLAARMIADGRPYRTAVGDPDASPAEVALLRSLGKVSSVGVPIRRDGEVWGEVWATTAGARQFDESDARFLQAIADRLALVLARGERFASVSRLAYEDPLTGLANRRAVEERLGELLDPARAEGLPLTLLLADVDGLKDINDAHGHHVGDGALCRVADALIAAAAPESAGLVGRLAGDEFCVLLEGCDLAVAAEVAQTALDLLDADDELPVSLSFGAAEATAASTVEGLLRAADTAQYAAKRRGGGRLCTSTEADAAPALTSLGDRRELRGHRLDRRVDRAAARTLRLLDGDYAHRRVLDRIEAVAVAFAAATDAAAWAISRWERGSAVIRTAVAADDRDSRLRGLRMGLENETYRVDAFPQTEALLHAGCGCFVAHAAGTGADASERALLERLGFEAALVGAVAHGSGTFLIELYGDRETAPLAGVAVRLELLLRIAAAGRSS